MLNYIKTNNLNDAKNIYLGSQKIVQHQRDA